MLKRSCELFASEKEVAKISQGVVKISQGVAKFISFATLAKILQGVAKLILRFARLAKFLLGQFARGCEIHEC